jgi:iron complex outermembrane receptor protein
MIERISRPRLDWTCRTHLLPAASSALAILAFGIPDARAQLEEIVVTARKREESVLNVPVQITTLSAKQLDKFDLTSLEKISATMPQLVIVRGTSGSGANLSLRGIGSNFTSIAIEQSVAVNLDGIYYGQGRVINEAMFDLERVEVLKGPQALFFGKNATAGVISLTSKNPGDRFEAKGRVGYEFTSHEPSVDAMVSGPVTDTFGLRLAVHWSDMQEGLAENVAPSTTYNTLDIATGALTPQPIAAARRNVPAERDRAARLTARFTPSDQLTWTLRASVDRYAVSDATWNEELFLCPSGTPQKSPGQECSGNWKVHHNDLPAAVAATNDLLDKHGGRLYQDYDSYAANSDVRYTLPNVAFTWTTGYHHFTNYFLGDYDDTDATAAQVWGAERSQYTSFSTEARIQTTFNARVNLMAGLYYDSTRLDFLQDAIFPGGLEDSAASDPAMRYLTVNKVSHTQGHTFAAFGQLLWAIADQWQVTAGARFTDETKDSLLTQPYVIAPYQAFFLQYDPANTATFFADKQTFSNVSPEATVTWKPAENLTAYVSYKTGYKSGGFSISSLVAATTTLADLAFRPEKVKGSEAGIKAKLSGTVRLGLDLFNYKYEDLQVDFFDSPQLKYTTFNAGSARTRGIELDAEWAPERVRSLSLRSSVVYDEAIYTNFPGAPCYGGQTPAEGCVIGPVPGNPGSVRAYQNLKGKPTGQAPKWSASLLADYEFSVCADLILGLTSNIRYSDGYQTTSIDVPFARQDAYVSVDANLRLANAKDTWELALIGKNLTNEYVVLGAYDASGTGANTGTLAGVHSDQTGFFAPPRTYQLQFTYKY